MCEQVLDEVLEEATVVVILQESLVAVEAQELDPGIEA
jgi:hypothetical protein